MCASWRGNREDQIVRAIQNEIHKFRMESLERFRFEPVVYSADDARPVFDSKQEFLGFDKYKFGTWTVDQSMRVRSDKRGSVLVRSLGRWIPLRRFLEDLPPQQQDQQPEQLSAQEKECWLDEQRAWWRKTGKKFRLLDLPPEVRELIYILALAGPIEPYPRARCRGIGGSVIDGIIANNPNVKLLFASQQVYDEASHIMFNKAIFFVEHKIILQRLVTNVPLSDRMRRLRLALPHLQYLALFGIYVNLDVDFRPQQDASAIRSLRLDELVLEVLPARPIDDHEHLPRACLKTLVDWVFEAASEWVAGHPVTITGWAKDEQRQKFQAECDAARRDYLEWYERKPLGYQSGSLREWDEYRNEEDGGVRLDGRDTCDAVEGEDEMVVERGYPPLCRCSPSCEYHTWSPES